MGTIGLFPTIYKSTFAEGALHSATLHLQTLSALGHVIVERYQRIILHLPTAPYSSENVIVIFPFAPGSVIRPVGAVYRSMFCPHTFLRETSIAGFTSVWFTNSKATAFAVELAESFILSTLT